MISEFIQNHPALVITMYFILSLVIFFILEYKKKPWDNDFGGNLMISLFWPIILPIAIFIVPFFWASNLAKNLRETKQKKNQINGTNIIGKKNKGW